jgi:hypothetical protein
MGIVLAVMDAVAHIASGTLVAGVLLTLFGLGDRRIFSREAASPNFRLLFRWYRWLAPYELRIGIAIVASSILALVIATIGRHA